MPWNVVKTDRCPADRPWGVIGGASGADLRGCHPDQASARKQQQALYANVEEASMDKRMQCPQCGDTTAKNGTIDTCPTCGWTDPDRSVPPVPRSSGWAEGMVAPSPRITLLP